MKKFTFALSLLAVMTAGTVMADNTQTVTVDGSTVGKVVTAMEFSGDNVTLTYADNSTQTADISTVAIAFNYETTGIDAIENNSGDTEAKAGVYTLDGRYIGDSLNGLRSGLYIVNGKQTIIK